MRFAKPSGSAFDHGPGSTPRRPVPVVERNPRAARPRAAQRLAKNTRARSHPHPEPVRKELTAFEKSFAIENPRDLPEFTVVDLADLKGVGVIFGYRTYIYC